MKMELEAKQDSDALEYELQELFDLTSADLGSERLNRLARFSAKIPKEASPWLSPIFRQLSATSCLVIGLAVLSVTPSGDSHSPWSVERGHPGLESRHALGGELFEEPEHWDTDITTVGFDLLHGANQIDEALLEDSFQALLDESSKP